MGMDGRNYEMVFRNGKEQFRCRLCPFPFLFGQISDLSRHIAIFHEGKKPHMKYEEKIETEQAQEFEEALKHDFIFSNDAEIQQPEVQEFVPSYTLPHTPHCSRLSAALLKKNPGDKNIDRVYERKKPVQCALCQKIFSELFYLRLHFVNVHHQGKNYSSAQ